VFWQRYQELPDWEKVIKNIERGEQKIQRQADIMQAVRTKLDRYKNPWQELKVGVGKTQRQCVQNMQASIKQETVTTVEGVVVCMCVLGWGACVFVSGYAFRTVCAFGGGGGGRGGGRLVRCLLVCLLCLQAHTAWASLPPSGPRRSIVCCSGGRCCVLKFGGCVCGGGYVVGVGGSMCVCIRHRPAAGAVYCDRPLCISAVLPDSLVAALLLRAMPGCVQAGVEPRPRCGVCFLLSVAPLAPTPRLTSYAPPLPVCVPPDQVNYGANKGKAYTEEEDRFIVCSIAKLGYGAWDELKADIRGHWRFRWGPGGREGGGQRGGGLGDGVCVRYQVGDV